MERREALRCEASGRTALNQPMMIPTAAAAAAAAPPHLAAAVAAPPAAAEAERAVEAAVHGHAAAELRLRHRRFLAAPCAHAPERASLPCQSRAPRCPQRDLACRCTTEGRSAGAEGRRRAMAPPPQRRLLRLGALSPCAPPLRVRARAGPRRWTGGRRRKQVVRRLHRMRAAQATHRSHCCPVRT